MDRSAIQSGVADTLMVLLMLALAHTVGLESQHGETVATNAQEASPSAVVVSQQHVVHSSKRSGNGSTMVLDLAIQANGKLRYDGQVVSVKDVRKIAKSRHLGVVRLHIAHFRGISHTMRKLRAHGLSIQVN